MRRDDVIRRLTEQRRELEQNYGVETLFLFGSTARDEASPESDVDLLVEFGRPIGLFKFIELQQHLESLLECKVDLGTKRSLKPFIKDEVLKDAIRVA